MGYRNLEGPLATAEYEIIKRALEDADGNREAAAASLCIGERTLYRKIKRYGLGTRAKPAPPPNYIEELIDTRKLLKESQAREAELRKWLVALRDRKVERYYIVEILAGRADRGLIA